MSQPSIDTRCCCCSCNLMMPHLPRIAFNERTSANQIKCTSGALIGLSVTVFHFRSPNDRDRDRDVSSSSSSQSSSKKNSRFLFSSANCESGQRTRARKYEPNDSRLISRQLAGISAPNWASISSMHHGVTSSSAHRSDSIQSVPLRVWRTANRFPETGEQTSRRLVMNLR